MNCRRCPCGSQCAWQPSRIGIQLSTLDFGAMRIMHDSHGMTLKFLYNAQGNDDEILSKQQAAEKVLQEARAAAQKQIQEAKAEATAKSEKRLAEVKGVRASSLVIRSFLDVLSTALWDRHWVPNGD